MYFSYLLEVFFQFQCQFVEFIRISVSISLPDFAACVYQIADHHIVSVEVWVANLENIHGLYYHLRAGSDEFARSMISGVSGTMVIGVSWK